MIKKEIRALYKSKRQAFSKAELELKSQAIFDQANATIDFSGKRISIFLPIERFAEINTWHFIDNLSNQFFLPTIREDYKLEHILYENRDQISVNSWGIPEPENGKAVSEKELDIVLVPLLAVDRKGFRVGYGKGFYDRFISKCRADCEFIGLNYFDPINFIADTDENDIALHSCISPTGIIHF